VEILDLTGQHPVRGWQLGQHAPQQPGTVRASLHVSFGFALIGAIVGEFLGAQQGLGLLIRTAQGTFNANGVLAAMVIVAIVALIAEGQRRTVAEVACDHGKTDRAAIVAKSSPAASTTPHPRRTRM
jgi:ABC-type proline/glycine betaine transport system permease subunit